MKPCFFCNQHGQRPAPGQHVHYPNPTYPTGFHPGHLPCAFAIQPVPVHCMHCESKGFKEFAGRMDPCFFCNKDGQRPMIYNAVHCIHCKSTGWS